MNIRDVANGVVFTKLNFNMDSFEERLIFQKKMYLLQGLGTDLGYSYNWYIRGPYSPGLSKYAYSNYEMLSEADYSGYTLVGDTEKNINIVNELRNDNDEEMSVGKWYELLASLLYLYHNHGSFMIKEFDSNAIADKLVSLKPTFSKDNCLNGIMTLEKKGFIKGETLDN